MSCDGRGELVSCDGREVSSSAGGCGTTATFGSSGDKEDLRGGGNVTLRFLLGAITSSSSSSVVTASALDDTGAILTAPASSLKL